MKKKNFRSQLFRKEINENDPEYWIKVYAELLFRIDELEEQKCNCFKCQTDLDKYLKFIQKLRVDKTCFYKSELDPK
jgi:hypothetical protein